MSHPQKELETLVNQHTISPSLGYFSDVAASRYDEKGHLKPEPQKERLYFSSDKRRATRPAFCRTCVAVDIERIGVPMIHREHQLMGITMCTNCKRELEFECPICQSMRSRFDFFTIRGPCSVPGHPRRLLTSAVSNSLEEQLSLAKEIVHSCTAQPARFTKSWGSMLAAALVAVGCRRGTTVHAPLVGELLRETFSPALLQHFRLEVVEPDGLSMRTAPALRRSLDTLLPVQKIIVAMAISGNLRSFEQACSVEEPRGQWGSSVWVPTWRPTVLESIAAGDNLTTISEKHGLSKGTLRSELRALGIPMPNWDASQSTLDAVRSVARGMSVINASFRYRLSAAVILTAIRRRLPARYCSIREEYFTEQREQHRQRFLSLVDDADLIIRGSITKVLGATLTWMAKNDRKWLRGQLNTHKVRRGRKVGTRLRLAATDAEAAARDAAESLYSRRDTRRVTPARIVKEAGIPRTVLRDSMLGVLIVKLAESEDSWWQRRIRIHMEASPTSSFSVFRTRFASKCSPERTTWLKNEFSSAGLRFQ